MTSSTLIESLPLAIHISVLTASSSFLWIGGGVTLCLIELFLSRACKKHYKFVPLILGINALIVGIFISPYALFANDSRWQIAYWVGLSTACIIWVRPMLPRRKKFAVPDATEAQILTEILPGQIGQALYEGCLWPARTEGYQGTIAPNQKVYVLRREGNTLIVLPETLFHR